MSRIQKLFRNKQGRILNVFCTAGFPEADSTIKILTALQQAGVDMIEIGMPYSDPLADGPVIQKANMVALSKGMTLSKLFADLENMRSVIHLPVVLMGYFNPVLQFGFENFCSGAAAVGIDGLIIPDLPDQEYVEKYQAVVKKYELDFIFLITPETSFERVKKLDSLSSGFLYAVASSSLTGSENQWDEVVKYLERISSYKLKNEVLVGFGIRDRKSFELASAYAKGAIIGTAYLQALNNADDAELATKKFIHSIREGEL